MSDQPVVTLDEILAGAPDTEYVADAFGPGRGIYIMAFDARQYEAWQDYAAKRCPQDAKKAQVMVNTLEVGACLLTAADPAARLFPTGTDLATLERFKARVWAGYWQRLVTRIDVLSGFASQLTERLAAAGLPTVGESSDSGVSTASDDDPASAEDPLPDFSAPSPTTSKRGSGPR